MEKKKQKQKVAPHRKRKKRKKVYRLGRLRINIVAGVTNILAILICAVFIYNFFAAQFTLSEILQLVFVLFFTETLIANIIALYLTRNNRLPIIGQSLGILGSVLMLGYPALGAFPAFFLFIAATILVLRKERYLVSPKRKKKPLYKNPMLVAALLVSLLFGGFQAYAAMQTDETPVTPVKVKQTKQSSSSESERQESESESTSSQTNTSQTEESTAPSESSTPEEPADVPADPEPDRGTSVDGLAIKVDRLEEKNEVGEGENAYRSVEDTKYVLIYITVHNEANEERMYSNNDFIFVDGAGEEYSMVPVIDVEGAIEGVELEPTASDSGFITFEIPKDLDPYSCQLKFWGVTAEEPTHIPLQ